MSFVGVYMENLHHGELMADGKYRAYQLSFTEDGQPIWHSSEAMFKDDDTVCISTVDVTHESLIQAIHGYYTVVHIQNAGPKTAGDASKLVLEDPDTGNEDQLVSLHSMDEIRYTFPQSPPHSTVCMLTDRAFACECAAMVSSSLCARDFSRWLTTCVSRSRITATRKCSSCEE